jgi:FkbM family methyltransferase
METPVWRFHCGLKALPERVLRRLRGRAVIDGGAYWGDSALVFSTYGPSLVYAFEPQPDTYETLRTVLRDNGLEELVRPVRAGLGRQSSTAKLYTGSMRSGANLFAVGAREETGESRVDEIDLVSIDEFMRDKDQRVGLIKLDVEGSESDAIAGAMETIRRDRPILAISIYHTPRDFFDIKPMLEAENLGYHFLVRKFSFNDLVTEVMLLGYPEEEEK